MIYAGVRQTIGMYFGTKRVQKVYLGEAVIYAISSFVVSCTFDNVTSNAPEIVGSEDSLSVTLSATSGNKVQANSVVVTMGGVDITSTSYNHSTKTITIASVTGNVSITAIGRPYDAEVEYLQSDGTAYIDLGKKINSDTDVIDLDFISDESTTSAKGLFGARAGASSKNFSAIIGSLSNVVVDVNNGNYSTYRINAVESALGKRCIVHIEKSNKSISYDGVTMASSTTSSQSFSTSLNAYLFATNGINDPSSIYLQYFKWARNGNLFFELIPVRKDGVGYLYDKVSKTLFGNANSSGAFSYGNDV